MPRTSFHLAAADRALFRKCRRLNTDIDGLRAALPDPEVITALERLSLDELPPDRRRIAARILRDNAELAAKEAELKALTVSAERAARCLPNVNLRRIVQLYCLDGMSYRDVIQSCPCCERTVQRWIAFLNRHAVEGNTDGASD